VLRASQCFAYNPRKAQFIRKCNTVGQYIRPYPRESTGSRPLSPSQTRESLGASLPRGPAKTPQNGKALAVSCQRWAGMAVFPRPLVSPKNLPFYRTKMFRISVSLPANAVRRLSQCARIRSRLFSQYAGSPRCNSSIELHGTSQTPPPAAGCLAQICVGTE